MKYNFVVTGGGEYFNTTIDLKDDETIDYLLDELQELAYDKVQHRGRDVFIFTNNDGVDKFTKWLIEKFGVVPMGQFGDVQGLNGVTTYHIQPFGRIHILEIG